MADKPAASDNSENQPWLQRQWQRVRNLWARDIVIGQVGEGATNVVIGKNNVQINIGGRNLTLPIYLIVGTLLVILGILIYPLVNPIWNPTQMTGPFRIALANFGEIDARGQVHATPRGEEMSKWFFDSLFSEYQGSQVDVARTIEIWHDLRPDIKKNVTFGVMRGNTVEVRRAAAAKLANRVAAHMIIYGNLVTDGDRPQLALEFYLSPLINDETAAIVGSHRLGRPITLPAAFSTGSPDANTAVATLLKVRTDAFFWLTVGLIQDILGRSQEALTTFRLAETMLSEWQDEDGKELLYFFIGRQELFLDDVVAAEAAFRHALAINPTYARAQVALGSALWKQAFAVPPTERFQPPNLLLQALDNHVKGLELAAKAQEPLVINLANLALAKTYRLLGETYFHLDQSEQARHFFDISRQKVTQVIEPLKTANQFRLLAQAYEVEGAAYLQEGVLLLEENKLGEAGKLLEQAKIAYQHCVEQGREIVDKVLETEVIGEGCQHYSETTDHYLQQVGKGQS
jgi:tetratricopeptide (TPR) repeat protein